MDKIGLTSNKLKIIAIITMIIDHIGYYFYYIMPETVYLLLRIVGRVSMPIFVFLLVQGYFKTSDIKRYIIRLFKYALITQLAILGVYLINHIFIPNYDVGVHKQLNILFSFCLSILLIYMIDKNNTISDFKIINIFIKIFVITFIILIYLICKIDYNFIVPVMTLLLYFNEIFNNKEYTSSKYKIGLILIIIICAMLQNYIGKFSILSVIFILLYNGELGRKNIALKRLFYIIFPLQHCTLYILSMILFLKLS